MERFKFIVIFVFFVVISVYAFAEQERFSPAIKRLEEKDVEEMLGEKKPATEDIIVKPNVEYKTEDLRDPFCDPFAPEKVSPVAGLPTPEVPSSPKVLPSLEVQGIIWGGDFPLGIINNKVVKIGDTIEDVQIMDINQSGVIVAFGDYTYNLPSPAQKQAQEHQGGEK
jgi:hypothetical protein